MSDMQKAVDEVRSLRGLTVDEVQRESDLCTYGMCWCGEPRKSRTVYEVDEHMWRSELVCYAGHRD